MGALSGEWAHSSKSFILLNMAICTDFFLQEWPHENEGSDPTVAFIWKNAPAVRGKPRRRYNRYMNDLDCVTQAQVTCPTKPR
jgi:hypothetical protein